MSETKHKVTVTSDVTDVKRGAAELEKSFMKAFVGAQAAMDIFKKGMGVLTDFVKDAIANANEYERTVMKLTSALKNANIDVGIGTQYFEHQSASLQKLTGVSDEAIRTMQSIALNMGVSGDRVEDFIKASIRLANVTGMDATQAMRQLVKSTSGLKGELGEALPQVAAMTAEQLRAGEAIDVVNEAFSESLGIMTKGGAGAEVGLTNAWKDFSEAIGLAVTQSDAYINTQKSMTSTLEELTRVLNDDTIPAWKTYLAVVTDVAKNIGLVMVGQGARASLGITTGLEGDQTFVDKWGMGTAETAELTKKAPGKKAPPSTGGGKLRAERGALQEETAIYGEQVAAYEAMLEEKRRAADEMMVWEQNEMLANMEQMRDSYQGYLDGNTRAAERAARERMEVEREAAAEQRALWEANYAVFERVALGASNVALDALFNLMAGEESAFASMMKSFLENTGKSLVAGGIRDALQGAATVIRGVATDDPKAIASGGSLAAIGGVQIAAGTAMMGGSLLIPGGQAVPAGGGGSGGGSAFSGGGGFSGGSAGPPPGELAPIVININGSMTNEETMLHVRRSMRQLAERGY